MINLVEIFTFSRPPYEPHTPPSLRTTGLDGLRIFHSKNVGEPIEYWRCLSLPCFNKFALTQKNL